MYGYELYVFHVRALKTVSLHAHMTDQQIHIFTRVSQMKTVNIVICVC